MIGDIGAAVAVVKSVQARVHLNGLEPERDGFAVTPQTPRTVIVPPHHDLAGPHVLGRMFAYTAQNELRHLQVPHPSAMYSPRC